VNNAQREDQEFMGTVDAAARENGAVLEALTTKGVAVYPTGADQLAYGAIWRDQSIHTTQQISFTLDAHAKADVHGQNKQEAAHQILHINSDWGNMQLQLSLLGAHNAHNALAAATAALAAGAPVVAVVQGSLLAMLALRLLMTPITLTQIRCLLLLMC
jgi:UDP-N-acetylmuramyl pentapeptide synthase